MEHGELANTLFREGYNCAQSVFCAFSDVTGMDREASARLASSLGGGMGRLREVCGAMSAALLVLGIARGYSSPGDPEAKKAHYALVQEFASRFRAAHGSILCRELLSGVPTTPGAVPEARTEQYYTVRPCPNIVREAAEILDALLRETEA